MPSNLVTVVVSAAVGSIITFVGSVLRERFWDVQKRNEEVRQVKDSIIYDIDHLHDSFEGLYAEASDFVGADLRQEIKNFRPIQPINFSNFYKIKQEVVSEVADRINDVRVYLQVIEKSHADFIDTPPEEIPAAHWSLIQSLLAALAFIKRELT